jgi:hypothetical protein
MISNYTEKLRKNPAKFNRITRNDIFDNTREPFKASNHFEDFRMSAAQTLSPQSAQLKAELDMIADENTQNSLRRDI